MIYKNKYLVDTRTCTCTCMCRSTHRVYFRILHKMGQIIAKGSTYISIINHTLLSTIRSVISTLTCMSMASNNTSDSKCYLAIRVHVRVLLLP